MPRPVRLSKDRLGIRNVPVDVPNIPVDLANVSNVPRDVRVVGYHNVEIIT